MTGPRSVDPDGSRTDRRSGVGRARSILLAILGIEVAVLVATGVALFFLYRPIASESWGDLVVRTDDWGVRAAYGLRLLHRLASQLAVLTAIAAGVLVAVDRGAGARRWPGPVLAVGLGATTLAASFTGFLLPWDQLALWAVTAGTRYTGYRVLFGEQVRFVLMGGLEIETGTVVRWLLVHTLVLGPAVVGFTVLTWRRTHTTSGPGVIAGGSPHRGAR